MKTGITGGIGSGKSYVCKLLAEHGIEVYDCDSAAKRLMRESAEIRRQLTAIIGPDTYRQATDERGQTQWILNKAAVAQFLLTSEQNAHAVDAIVHPAVFRDFQESGMLWMESAIMFESGINRLVDRIVVVTAPEHVRIERIIKRDGITAEKAREWIARQWSQEEVCKRADFEIINDGQHDLKSQIESMLRMR